MEDKPQLYKTFSYLCVIFDDALLAKEIHVAKLRVQSGRDSIMMWIPESVIDEEKLI